MLMYLFNLTGLHSNQFHANSEAPKAFWTFVLIIAVPQLKRNAISIKWKIKPNRQTHTIKTKFGFKMASEFCESEIKWTDQQIELPAKWVGKGRVGVVQGLCKISNCSCQLQRKVHGKFCPLRALFVRPRQIEYEMKRAFSGKLWNFIVMKLNALQLNMPKKKCWLKNALTISKHFCNDN